MRQVEAFSHRRTETIRPLLLMAIGGAAGFVGGLLGGGGGLVTIPSLDHLTRWPRVTCHGTSTLVTSFIGIAGIAAYWSLGASIAPIAAAGMIVGGVLGAQIGARAARLAPERMLRLLFIMVLLAALVDLAYPATIGSQSAGHALFPNLIRDHAVYTAACTAAIGLVVGLWSSAMGLGGGMLAVPALVLLFGYEQHVAEATSLVIMLPNALSGATAHARQGTADLRVGTIAGLGALPGSIAGVLLALGLATNTLRLVFAAFMLLIVIREMLAFSRYFLTRSA